MVRRHGAVAKRFLAARSPAHARIHRPRRRQAADRHRPSNRALSRRRLDQKALIHTIAEKLGGSAFHVAVDSDAPKHLNLRWPGESIPITDDPKINSAAWTTLLNPPSPAHVDEISRKLNDAAKSWGFEPILPSVLASLRRLTMETLNLPIALTNALHELDLQLGLRHHALLASPIWSSEPYLLFVHDLIANAQDTAMHYNNALDAYRIEAGIHSRMRPMPDLFTSIDSV